MRATLWTLFGLLLGGCFVDGGAATSLSGAGTTDAMTGGSSGSTAAPTSATTGEVVTGSGSGSETDGGSTGSPEGMACDPFAQDCPDGFKCAPYATDGGPVWDANHCVPVTGNDEPGQGCTADGGGTSGYDSCVAGALCIGVELDGTGTCVSLCGGTAKAPTCSPGLACLSTNDGALNECVQICDPLQAESCVLVNDVCVPYGDDFVCVADGSDGTEMDYVACTYINECGAGRFCGVADLAPVHCAKSELCCVPLCSLEKQGPCFDGTTCLPYFEGNPPAKYADLGYCGEG